ncbi:hypothetical protein [Micromonospora sp. NPDC049679]|uniref:hypothetical protein n=1 Tax=Micromonospora sp. NPDC049679 TaxID=3155920 RepID=UPI00340D971E
MTTARAFDMPAEQAREAADVAAEGNVVYLTDPAGHRLAAVVPTETADTALVLAAAAQTRQRLAAFETAASQRALGPDEATAHMLARGEGPPDAEHFARVLRAEGLPADQITAEAHRLATEAAHRSA